MRLRANQSFVVLCLLLASATALVYAQVWKFDFILLDDPLYVSQNPYVTGGLTRANIVWALTNHLEVYWIPLTWLSLMLDTTVYAPLFGGLHAGGYHLTNVVLHVLNTLVLFAFLVRMTGKQARSAFVAALFALHPLHVESVAWITERKDVLNTFFGLLSLLAYASYVKSRRRWALAASLICFVLSLTSKPSLVTLPFLLLLLDFWPLNRFQPGALRRLVLEKVPFFLVSAGACVLTMVQPRQIDAQASSEALPLLWRFLNAITVYALYLWQTVFPQNLAVFYPHPRESLSRWGVAAAATVLVSITGATIALRRRFPFLLVGWAWYLGTLVPAIGIVQVGSQQMADRYTYFPLIGPFIAVTWLIAETVRAEALRVRILPTAAVAGLGVLAVTTYSQVSYWQDNESLFSHAIDCGRDSAVARCGLGNALIARGEAEEGIAMLETAVRMEPEQSEWHLNLAVALQAAERLDRAAKEYRVVIAMGKRDLTEARARNNLGFILWKHDHDAQSARREFLEAVAIDPDQVQAYLNLAPLCDELGLPSEAQQYRTRARQIDPSSIAKPSR